MLVRYQGNSHEIYAWKENNKLSFYAYSEDDLKLTKKAKISKMKPVEKMVCWWVDKEIKISCDVAYTEMQKREGLQSTPNLSPSKGLYFPYSPSSDVTFHQGSVNYPLDIIFVRNDQVVKIQANTQPGTDERWSCKSCDGVIEVRGGFCKSNNVGLGDFISMIGLTAKDLNDFENQLPVENDEEYFQTTSGKGYCPDITTGYFSSMLGDL